MIAGTRLDLLEAMETLERDHPQFVEPLLLRDVYGLAYEEIAEQVGAPLGTVKAQIHHGRKLVRPMLAEVPSEHAGAALGALVARRDGPAARGPTACSGDGLVDGRAAPSEPAVRRACRASPTRRPAPTTRTSTAA